MASVLLSPASAWAWGDLGHLRVTQSAHGLLPNGCLRTWYYDNGMALMEASLAPDAWRDTDPNEGPRHFLDIDLFGSPSTYPRDLNQAIQQHGANVIYANGTVPWVVDSVYAQLVAAFRAGNTASAVARSGYLSHYVSDAYSPYHATVNYDGQLTGNRGIHGRYETDMIDAHDAQVASGLGSNARTTTKPAAIHHAIFDVLEHGVTLVPGINQVDIASGGNITVLWASKGSEAVSLMAQSAGLINALWRAAYQEAGSPVMPGMPASCGQSVPAPDAGTGTPPDAGSSTPSTDAGSNTPGSDAGSSTPVADAGPTEPGPTEPDPTEPGPTEPGPTEPGPTEPCACDVDFCCSEGCACDPECGCACDTTFACDEGCACDPECHQGCPGFVSAEDSSGGGSCQSALGPRPGEVLILLLALALLRRFGARLLR